MKKRKVTNLAAKVRKKNGLRKQRGLFFKKNNFIAFSLTRKDSQKMPNEQLF